jgi:LDH2 family malate/lactate/ureidoglycolate dehydrogenase
MAERERFDSYLDPAGTRALCERILTGAGLPADQSAVVVDNLVRADLRGISSHGISRMAVYAGRVASGGLSTDGRIEIVSDAPAAMRIDARNNMGAVAGTQAMRLVIERARTCGIAAATVFNGNHYGFAAYYSMMALESDMIGVALSNAPPTMAPWGGMAPMMGTNPFSIAAPAAKHRPLVLDCASSYVARGKINLADIEKKPIPEGWALDADGHSTTDAAAALAGVVLPFGTYKGSGIAIMIDVLSAVLSGASFGMHVGQLYRDADTPQNLGHFFAAIHIGMLSDPVAFKAGVDQIVDDIKGSRKAPGTDEIFLPGELEFENEIYYMKKGIGVGAGVLRDLRNLSQTYGDGTDPEILQKPE